MRNYRDGIKEKGEKFMAKKNGVSSKTHTQKQLDDYANQHNPNNKAFKARVANEAATSKKSQKNAALRRANKNQSFLMSWV